jgi:hypothetical protein
MRNRFRHIFSALLVRNLLHLKKFIFLFSFVLLFNFYNGRVYAQNSSDTTAISKPAVKYIEKFDTIISIKLNVNTEFDEFEQKGDNFHWDLRPNISLSTKLSFSYRYISFGIGFKPKFIPGNNDNDMQGKTKALGFGLNILTIHWMQELQFAYVSGFYIYNSEDAIPGWIKGQDPYFLLPDLKVAMLRGSTGYKINKNFSLKAVSSKTEIQLKSCGSIIPYLTYNYNEIDNKSSDTSQHSSQRSHNLDVAASLGYIYTFVIKSKFYATLGLFPGIGFHHANLLTRYPDENVRTKYTDPLYEIKETIGIGYNSKKFYSGAELTAEQFTHNDNHSSVQTKATRGYFQIFIGYRFNAPKFLKQKADEVKNLAPTPVQKFLN